MEITARQLGANHELPVHVPYRGLPGRLGGENLFAKSIIAKYTASEEQDLPSDDFAYPESGRAAAEAALSELTTNLTVLNRIRIQMNIRNLRILQRYYLSVSTRCDQILNDLSRRGFFMTGVSAAAVRELREIHRELDRNAEEAASAAAAGSVPPVLKEDGSVLLLRILTAASRGNTHREHYMRRLAAQLRETGAGMAAGTDSAGSAGGESLLLRAERELFRTESAGGSRIMTLWASEQARQFFWRIQRAPEQERELFLRAGGFSSVISFEKYLQTMDDVTFRNYSASLLERVSVWMQDQEERRAVPENDSPGKHLSGMITFLGESGTEEWELFRRELLHADTGGLVRSLAPELFRGTEGAGEQTLTVQREKEVLFRVLREDRDAVRQLRILVLETIQRVSLIRENQKDYLTLTESIRNLSSEQWDQLKEELKILQVENESIRSVLPPELFHAEGRDSGADASSPEGAPAAERLVVMQQEKELLFRILREDRDAVRQLRILVLETIRRISVIRENQKEYLTLAESIMNLTTEQWDRMKEDIEILRKEDLEIRARFPEDMFAEAGRNQAPAPAELPEAERSFREAGIRMSSEKLIFLKALQEQSLRPDSLLSETGRKLYIRTVLKSTEAGKLIRPSYRELSAEGKENWRRFLADLLSPVDSTVSGGTSSGLYFGRITGRYGITFRNSGNPPAGAGDLTGAALRTEAALSYLEREREERIFTAVPSAGTEPAGAPEITAAADLTVPAAQGAGQGAGAAGNGRSRGTGTLSAAEISHDIEFETVTRSSREEEHVTDIKQMKELHETLERHEREISKLVRNQEAISQQDLPKEMIRQLNNRLRMERLRGGL